MLLSIQKEQTFCEGQLLHASFSVSPVLFQGDNVKSCFNSHMSDIAAELKQKKKNSDIVCYEGKGREG